MITINFNKLIQTCALWALPLAFVSCKKDFQGKAQVHSSFKVEKRGLFSKDIIIGSGNYYADVKGAANSSSINVSLKNTANTFKFSLPSPRVSNNLNQNFFLSAQDLNQNFSASGKSTIQIIRRGQIFTTERSCVYSVEYYRDSHYPYDDHYANRRHHHDDYDHRDRRDRYRDDHRDRTYIVYGTELVTKQAEISVHSLRFKLLNANNVTLANFNVSEQERTNYKVLSKSECML